MVETTQSPLAMLVLVTPYTLLYVLNELFLHGVLDKVHYLFFELIFVFAFRKVFGLPDLTDRFLSSFPFRTPIHSVDHIPPLKTTLVSSTTTTIAPATTKPLASAVVSTPRLGDIKDSAERRTLSTTPKPVSRPVARTQRDEGPYFKELGAMEKKFMDYIHNTEIWEKVYEDTSIRVSTDSTDNSTSWIQVFQYKSRPMCYKIIAYMNSSPAVLFDTLCDLDRRSEWDPMCVEARVLEQVKPGTTIQYVRTKAVWPTASRDTVVLGTVKDLGDKGLFMVNSSIEHDSMPERVKEKIVRMETAVAGHIITPVGERGDKSKLIQILDADLKGWIPEKVIQMVSTKAVPDGLRAINGLIPKMELYSQSKALLKAVQEQMELDTTLMDPRPKDNGDDFMLEADREKDMDPAEVQVSDDDGSGQHKDGDNEQHLHTLRHQRSVSDITLSSLSDRLRAVDDQVGVSRRASRHEVFPRQQSHKAVSLPHANNSGNNNTSNNSAGALEKTRSSTTGGRTGIFRAFWEGVKETVGLGLTGKTNKVLVAVIVVAVLGTSVARRR